MQKRLFISFCLTCLVFSNLTLTHAEEQKLDLARSIGLPDSFEIDGKMRSRYEFTDWFNAGKAGIDNKDSFSSLKSQLGLQYKNEGFKVYVQGEYDQLFDLAKNTDGGPSAAYRNFNEGKSNPGNLYFRQAFAEYSNITESGIKVLVGRFLYSSGNEVDSKDATLSWLKKARISERLIGPFDYAFGRSFDGGRGDYSIDNNSTITLSAFRPTQGGFDTDGMETITDISVITSAFTHQYKFTEKHAGELQFFYYRYEDDRNAVKPDNRALDVRQNDNNNITINNYGAHLVNANEIGSGTWETVFWGVLQEGDWGKNQHSAQAFAAETGYRFDEIHGKPWLRTGLNWGSGDSNPNDNKHGTFFEMLPTARIYAMTPFYNMMNMQDFFVQGIWKPLDKVSLRSDVHVLNTTDSEDSFYSGAGANNRDGAFGYAGSVANGSSSIGTLIDGAISYEFNQHVGLSFYYGYLISGSMPEKSFSKKDNVEYGFVELNLKL